MLSGYLYKIKTSSLVHSTSFLLRKSLTKDGILSSENSSENCTFPFQHIWRLSSLQGKQEEVQMPKQKSDWLQILLLNPQCQSVSREARDVCGVERSIIYKLERCVFPPSFCSLQKGGNKATRIKSQGIRQKKWKVKLKWLLSFLKYSILKSVEKNWSTRLIYNLHIISDYSFILVAN